MYNNSYSREYPSIYRGIVESNDDPENLGRCKVRVPAVHGQSSYGHSILPWARPIALSPVGKSKGSVNIPDVGDVVWVIFEGAIKDFPVYFGGTYAKDELPIDKNRIDFYIEDDTKISYDRENNKYSISIGGKSLIFSGDLLSCEGDLKISGDLSVEGSISVTGDMNVGGTATLNNLIVLSDIQINEERMDDEY